MTDSDDVRQHPERYRRDGDPLLVEPYASEIVPHWRFATLDEASESAARLYELYLRYKEAGEFVGMDVVARLLKLGRVRAEQAGLDVEVDLSRPSPAAVFSKTYRMVKNDPDYEAMRQEWEKRL